MCETVVLNSLDKIVIASLSTVHCLVRTAIMESPASVIWDILETFETLRLTIIV